jgi:hypothetical protein
MSNLRLPSRSCFNSGESRSHESSIALLEPLSEHDIRPMSKFRGLRIVAKPSWEKVLIWTAVLACMILVLNILWMVIATAKYPYESGTRILFQGSCTRTTRIDTGLHIIINILGTALLGASNYVMQCLGSPTRSEDMDDRFPECFFCVTREIFSLKSSIPKTFPGSLVCSVHSCNIH